MQFEYQIFKLHDPLRPVNRPSSQSPCQEGPRRVSSPVNAG